MLIAIVAFLVGLAILVWSANVFIYTTPQKLDQKIVVNKIE